MRVRVREREGEREREKQTERDSDGVGGECARCLRVQQVRERESQGDGRTDAV